MAFQISPGVNVSEIDLTTIVPAVSTTEGAIAGVFSWGPVETRNLISSEDELVLTYGKPNANNFETWFSAANFLAYGNQLYVTRAANSTNFNAIANTAASGVAITTSNVFVKNADDYITKSSVVANYTNIGFLAKCPGSPGNSLKISVCPSVNAYSQDIQSTAAVSIDTAISVGSAQANITFEGTGNDFASNTLAATIKGFMVNGDYIKLGNTTVGIQYLQVANLSAITVTNSNTASFAITFDDTLKIKTDIDITTTGASNTAFSRNWEYFNSVDGAPGQSNYVANRNSNTAIKDEMHIVIADEDGVFSGTPGQILEVWQRVSRATDAKGEQGGSNYFEDILQNNSRYVFPGKSFVSPAATDSLAVYNGGVITSSFGGGGPDDDSTNIPIARIMEGYDLYASAEDIDISFVLQGKARGGSGEQLANYLIDNVAEVRKDCIVFISPPSTSTVNVPNLEQSNLVTFRNLLRSTSYAVLDSGHKYQYDKYNDLYRYVPMNGDLAGLCVRTDNLRDPWFSPAGFNRGAIKNIIKLAYNPDKADRDQLYKSGINPVVNFPGQGTVLYGDKTLLAKPSAFDRINVRRLFIVLEKAIATAAKFTLFEFNDEFTRAQFRNLVEPFLRDVQGRRGIYDFKVVCDTTNNTPEVIDRNEFRGDIYIKPARSINFIQLNFVAVRTGVEFDEIVGRF